MFPINNFRGIEIQESDIKDKHVVIFLLVKPSDAGANYIIDKFNYLHHLAGKYCSIYPIGYSKDFFDYYKDVQPVKGVNNEKWLYSDQCFIEFCADLSQRLKGWDYCGEPEIIVLQNKLIDDCTAALDFRNYNYIDINYGIQKGYIDSFERFMQRLLTACQKEVEGYKAIGEANKKRLKPRNVLEMAIEMMPKLPKTVKLILKDKLFYKSSKTKN